MTQTVVCIGGVVQKADSVLLVRQSPGHSLEGQWTIPWGQLASGESPSDAVLREIREEAGVVAEVNGLIGVQELPEPWLGMVGILFHCTHVDGRPTPDMRETDAAAYFRYDQLDEIAGPLEPLSAWLIQRILASDFQLVASNDSGPFFPSPTYL